MERKLKKELIAINKESIVVTAALANNQNAHLPVSVSRHIFHFPRKICTHQVSY